MESSTTEQGDHESGPAINLDPQLEPHAYFTFSHYQASRNLLSSARLSGGGRFDLSHYPALFVYDILELPGTLAATLNHTSQLEMMDRVTPAKLYGSTVMAEVSCRGALPSWAQNGDDYIKGMAVFGQGKINRDLIRDFYGPRFGRKKIEIEITTQEGPKMYIHAYAWFLKSRYWEDVNLSPEHPLWVTDDEDDESEVLSGAADGVDTMMADVDMHSAYSADPVTADWVEGMNLDNFEPFETLEANKYERALVPWNKNRNRTSTT